MSRQHRFAELKAMPPRCVPVNGPILFLRAWSYGKIEPSPIGYVQILIKQKRYHCGSFITSCLRTHFRKSSVATHSRHVTSTRTTEEGSEHNSFADLRPTVPEGKARTESSTDLLYRNVGPISRSPCLTSNSVVSFDQSHGSATWLVTD